MTLLRRTFFSLSIACAAHAASVTGSIKVTPARSDVSDMVVSLQPVNAAIARASDDVHVTMLQKHKMFHPHVLAIRAGWLVDFPNADPIFHNAFSNYDGQLFDIGLYPPGHSRSVRFKRPGIVRVFCNIHPAMSAIIVVLDTPYFTYARADGRFELKNVPAGTYTLTIFDERAKSTMEKQLTVGESDLALEEIAVSETGYAQAPHKNKYGRDYPPDSATYGGVPK